MSKAPQAAPPSYTEAIGGVSPIAPMSYLHQGPSAPLTSAPVSSGPAIVTTIVPVGPFSTHMICPYCHAEIETSTRTTPGLIAYISGTVIALLGCFWGCCLIPCCFDGCMDVHHTCPNCKAFLGRFRR